MKLFLEKQRNEVERVKTLDPDGYTYVNARLHHLLAELWENYKAL